MERWHFGTRWLALVGTMALGAACAARGPSSSTPAQWPDGQAPASQGQQSLGRREPQAAGPSETRPLVEAVQPPAGGKGVPFSKPVSGTGVVPTTMANELDALGLAPDKLPALSKLPGDKLRKVMKLFNRSLGAKCSDCHGTDYSAPTPRKRIAEKMWDEFTRGYSASGGGVVFCDSCHHGRMKFLDRQDDNALGQWMETNFVHGLARHDSAEVTCSTCHGTPFDGGILRKWSLAQGRPPRGAP